LVAAPVRRNAVQFSDHRYRYFIATESASTSRAAGRGGLLVGLVVAVDQVVSATDVLAAAHAIVSGPAVSSRGWRAENRE
jgi:hypothetical protein